MMEKTLKIRVSVFPPRHIAVVLGCERFRQARFVAVRTPVMDGAGDSRWWVVGGGRDPSGVVAPV